VGILLYPTTGPALDEALVVDGHRLRLHTVNLAQGGPACTAACSACTAKVKSRVLNHENLETARASVGCTVVIPTV
jgi:hypothetical protein